MKKTPNAERRTPNDGKSESAQFLLVARVKLVRKSGEIENHTFISTNHFGDRDIDYGLTKLSNGDKIEFDGFDVIEPAVLHQISGR